MSPLDPTSGPTQAPLTDPQKAALAKLHTAAQQLEGLFIGMLCKSMRDSSPDTSITGKVSESEKTFHEMLDQERADKLSQSGSLGIAKMIETSLRASIMSSVSSSPQGIPNSVAPVTPPIKPLDEQKP